MKYRRLVVAGLSAVALTTVVAGCGGSSGTPSENPTTTEHDMTNMKPGESMPTSQHDMTNMKPGETMPSTTHDMKNMKPGETMPPAGY
jgi:hypothetical protein